MSLDVFWTGLLYAVRDRDTKEHLSLHQTSEEANRAREELVMEAEEPTCKREGCSEPVKATRGRYAYLCAEHVREASANVAAAAAAAAEHATLVDLHSEEEWAELQNEVTATNGSVPSLTHQVSELLAAALAVEEASDAFQAACSTYTDALAKVVEAQIK